VTTFSVPTNWDPTLLDALRGLPISDVYGSLSQTPVGSGRPKLLLPEVDRARAREHVASARAQGIKFNYLLNAPCMGNREFNKAFHGELLEHLQWIDSLEVDAVTVSMPYLLRLIKRQFPRLRVKVSVIAQVDSVPKARAYQDLGADEINVDYMCNRDFRTLEALRRSLSCELTLLCNDVCLFQCPYRQYHYNATGHSTQPDGSGKGPYFDFSMVSCTIEKLRNPKQLIRSRWIRPEDLPVYEQLSFDKFKLSGRQMPTAWIVRLVNAYVAQSYSGNLGDLLSGSIPEPSGRVHYHIDNRQLDGFLDHFKNRDCSVECHQCNYCETVANRVVTFPDPRVEPYLRSYEGLLEGLVNSDVIRM